MLRSVDVNAVEVINAHLKLARKIFVTRNLYDIARRLTSEQESLKENAEALHKFGKIKNSAISQLLKLDKVKNDPYSAAFLTAINFNLKGFFRFSEFVDYSNAGLWKKAEITFTQLWNSWERFLESIDPHLCEDLNLALKASDYGNVLEKLNAIYEGFVNPEHSRAVPK